MDELHRIGGLGRFDGSLLYLKHPDLTLALLRRSRKLNPQGFPQWQSYLASTMGPLVRSYMDGVLEDKQQYVGEEARKLLFGKGSAEMKAFYREVLKHEEIISIPFRQADDCQYP